MPFYDYECEKCEIVREEFHKMNETPEILCDQCGNKMRKLVSTGISFVLKGANWSGKNLREKSYREKRRKEMGRKMARSHDIPQIQPNYKGEVCKTWEEAKKLAKNDGVNEKRYSKQVDNLRIQQNKVKEKQTRLLKGEG